ncbi:hypothetical protein HX787_30295 [Pseudomonas tolaasii]|uniref:Uncharacterized protein n=1 Tax=Pseudomonas tolaasii TaxID=29442 RepID=A0A7Y8DSU6_PSETO|nr:hypothetical protein [Pseudomonas tolaasii]KAB0475675.1 hypothetical protein F7R12_14100 [Pseudomonas tolaasii]MBY8943866.1 hypothetical protein [Pseudomonas tolaasii]NWC24496.1 hypothetical protein [Pseudomonas tolaasii]NWC40117.1 hypothetical protein [Pseudomonas tolaasii]NWD40143.1 hypothetical protein [Pseudomonas tolaasii]
MSFFDIFKRNKVEKEEKRYPITSEGTDGVVFICSLIQEQFSLITMSGGKIPPILHSSSSGKFEIDQWLAGYILGFYDAFLQSQNQKYDPNALELIFSVFYGEEVAEESTKQCLLATLTLGDKSENFFKIAFDEFNDGVYEGGNNFMDWRDKKIQAPLAIYKKYLS